MMPVLDVYPDALSAPMPVDLVPVIVPPVPPVAPGAGVRAEPVSRRRPTGRRSRQRGPVRQPAARPGRGGSGPTTSTARPPPAPPARAVRRSAGSPAAPPTSRCARSAPASDRPDLQLAGPVDVGRRRRRCSAAACRAVGPGRSGVVPGDPPAIDGIGGAERGRAGRADGLAVLRPRTARNDARDQAQERRRRTDTDRCAEARVQRLGRARLPRRDRCSPPASARRSSTLITELFNR